MGWSMMATIQMATVIRMAIASSSWLGDIWNYLHATRYHTGWASTSGSIRRSSGATKSLRELLKKGATNIVCRNMDSVGNPENHE
jgi:hypothetical protein